MSTGDRGKLLLADNDPAYRRSVRVYLELENYRVVEAASAEQAISRLREEATELLLVDLRLTDDLDANDMSGLEVAKYATDRGVPCIVLTSYPSIEVVRQALRSRSGKSLAVDFIPKAGGPQAVIDAIAGFIRHVDSPGFCAALEVDLARQVIRKNGLALDLSRLQYALLAHLFEHRGTVCPPEDLIRVVYGDEVLPNEASADKRLERLIARLREKIEDDPSKPTYLLTVPGRGYRLEISS